jgi:hypothetical protein
MHAPPGSPGGWGEVLQRGLRDGRQKGDEATEKRTTDLHRLVTTGNVTLLESCHRDVPKVLDFSIAALVPSAGK